MHPPDRRETLAGRAAGKMGRTGFERCYLFFINILYSERGSPKPENRQLAIDPALVHLF
jgi:hypothetical protein